MVRVGDAIRRGLWAPVRAILPKNPWLRVLVYALPFVLVLALFNPAFDVVLKLFDLVLRVVEPLLQTTLGRILLLLVVFTLGSLFAVWLLRRRVRDMRAEAALGRHLQATAALVGLERRKSRELFRKVARYRGPLPDRYPHVVQDANLKLARHALEQGRIDDALGWLSRVVEPGLPDELVRSLLQLRLAALTRQGEVLPATLRREAEQAVRRFPKDYRLLCALRDLAAAAHADDEVLALQERIVKHAAPASAMAERQQFVDRLLAAGQRALADDDAEQARRLARKLQAVDKDGPSSALLLGDIYRHAGDLQRAVRTYGATRSPGGLDRIAELLDAHPGAVDPRELLACCPLQGGLLLVARELARAGDRERAERAARVAADKLGPTPTVCAVLAQVLDLLGEGQKAKLLREQAIARLLTAPAGDAAARSG